jgi:hypothetical protein
MNLTLSNKQWFSFTLAIILLMAGLCMTLNYYVDPLLQFRYNANTPPYIEANNRHINPGIIKHLDYDSVIMGTSMARNFRPANIETTIGGTAINLATSGSSMWEQNTALTLALDKGTVKTVYICLDTFMFIGSTDRGKENLVPYLYTTQPNISDRIKYLLSNHTTKLSFKTLLLKDKPNKSKHFDVKNSAYGKAKERYGKKWMLKEWHKTKKTLTATKTNSTEELRKNFEANLKSTLRNNPSVTFIIIYPPYSILFWANLDRKGELQSTLAFKQWLTDELSQYNNTVIYDLQDKQEITHNYDNYKDLYHYSDKVNRSIISYITNDSNQTTSSVKQNKGILNQLSNLNTIEL